MPGGLSALVRVQQSHHRFATLNDEGPPVTTHVLAIDQGTTSPRAMVFDHAGAVVASSQVEHRQHTPQPGWVEHDPIEIWDNVRSVVGLALSEASLTSRDIAAIGITNQRETTVVWDKTTG